ncbi:hypothetical protein EN817_03845 [Mesorhizobium sp. M3A.F.Ca.ET.174.01.1.1]|uniref:hypothetical protein n=1 Tax=unclassified Mesorhizobium TaxID=325217 RepID=UPI001093A501|nr:MULTISPECIES: hypothetical protein [unclassified Mesorhizobium]TGS89483.1 hypothetical protein EN818_03845 [Mesorhizobium sp. M3A.F.Ca.ET.175.01.1.1]TGT31256.1 hypothetical protein EN817_03845 [Mesorhizobium sp. M3A.F.Ca.ET.174.01.1.1]
MTPVRLEWQRPADGVDLIHDEELAKKRSDKDGRTIRARSDRTVPVTYEISNLENPIVAHFLNCRDDKDRAAFVARFGHVQSDDGWLGFVPWIEHLQEVMRVGLKWSSQTANTLHPQANSLMNDVTAKRVSLRPSFELAADNANALRLVLHPDSLASYMVMEIALAHEVGAVATTCEHCGKHFLTGPLTGRRSHAKYCSDRCRVAAMRKRNSSAEEVRHG